MRPRACQLEPGWASELKSRPHAHTCTPCIADTSGKAPALIVEKGGLLVADGRAEAPITFTALNPETTSTATVDSDTASEDGNAALQTRGKWGGLILLGKAPTNTPTSREVEGITGHTYGGSDPNDSSGVLRYVRVWHGGAVIGADNEINGITFAGVGSGTVVDHCEVAFNADDGFEFFGGTVNVKYLSALFVKDDAFDTDHGYQGKGQFLFIMEGSEGDHAFEMDSKNSDLDDQPRSHPQFYSVTALGGGPGAADDASSGTVRGGELMHVTDATGGKFGNMVLAHGVDNGLLFEKCTDMTYTSTLPAAGTDIGTGARGTTSTAGYFYFSNNNVVYRPDATAGTATYSEGDTACSVLSAGPLEGLVPAPVTTDPGFAALDATKLDYTNLPATFSPLPSGGGAACTGTKDAPQTDVDSTFYEAVSCKGAFASSNAADNWLVGWSWLDCNGMLAGGTCSSPGVKAFQQLKETVEVIPRTGDTDGSLASDLSLAANTSYLLSAQLFVPSGRTLTIAAGTTIFALPVASKSSPAPAIVVEQGGTITAAGTAANPITMTTIYAESILKSSAVVTSDSTTGAITLGERGKWGGLILLGNAPTSKPTGCATVEGITGKYYGGTDAADNSGTLQYVRVWHGGAIVGEDNEINGITFAGVGSGTTVDHCEVAYNADDGFEFFGGTVNVKYLSVLLGNDDSFDTDQGYQGKGQFLFTMLGTTGDHGTEMDSGKAGSDITLNAQPRSHPQFYHMTIIGPGDVSGSKDELMHLNDATGGKFGNLILTTNGGAGTGIYIEKCSTALTITQTMPAAGTSIGTTGGAASEGYLYIAPNNIIHVAAGATKTELAAPCSFSGDLAAVTSDPALRQPDVSAANVDPRPACDSVRPRPNKPSARPHPRAIKASPVLNSAACVLGRHRRVGRRHVVRQGDVQRRLWQRQLARRLVCGLVLDVGRRLWHGRRGAVGSAAAASRHQVGLGEHDGRRKRGRLQSRQAGEPHRRLRLNRERLRLGGDARDHRRLRQPCLHCAGLPPPMLAPGPPPASPGGPVSPTDARREGLTCDHASHRCRRWPMPPLLTASKRPSRPTSAPLPPPPRSSPPPA